MRSPGKEKCPDTGGVKPSCTYGRMVAVGLDGQPKVGRGDGTWGSEDHVEEIGRWEARGMEA